jgi:hypothetical protein
MLCAALTLTAACTADLPLGPTASSQLTTGSVQALSTQACWGQATQVFARMGEMGEHSSQFPTPRLGLRNLARQLADAGVIDDDSMQALGAFVADALGLSIDACTGGSSSPPGGAR